MSIEKFSVPSHLEKYITPETIAGKGKQHAIKSGAKAVTSKMSRIIKYFSEGLSRLSKSGGTEKKWYSNAVVLSKIGESSQTFQLLVSKTIEKQIPLLPAATREELFNFKMELDLAEKKAREFASVVDRVENLTISPTWTKVSFDKIPGPVNEIKTKESSDNTPEVSFELMKSQKDLKKTLTLIENQRNQIDDLLSNYPKPLEYAKLKNSSKLPLLQGEIKSISSHADNLKRLQNQIKTSGQAYSGLKECSRAIAHLKWIDNRCTDRINNTKINPKIKSELEDLKDKIQKNLTDYKHIRQEFFISSRMLQGIESIEETESLINGEKSITQTFDLRSQLHYIAAATKNAVPKKTWNSDDPVVNRFKEKLTEAEANLEFVYELGAGEMQSQRDLSGQIAVIHERMTQLTANAQSLTPVFIKTVAEDTKEFLHDTAQSDSEAPRYPKESPQAQFQENNRNAIKDLIKVADKLIDGADKALKNEEKTLQKLSPEISAIEREIQKAWETPLYTDKATGLEALRLKSKVMVDTLKELDVKNDSPFFEEFQNLQAQADTLLDDIGSKLKASRKIAVVESTHLQIEKFLGEARKLETSIKQPDNKKPVESVEKNIAEIKRLQKAVTRFGNEAGVSSKELNRLTKKVAGLAGPLKEQFFQSLTKEIELNKKAMLSTKHSETLTKEIRHGNYINLFEKFQTLEAKINTPTPVNQEADFRDLNQLQPEEKIKLNNDLKQCKEYLQAAFLENMESRLQEFKSEAEKLVSEYSKTTNKTSQKDIRKRVGQIQELSKYIPPTWSATWNSTMETLQELVQTVIETAPPVETKEYAGDLIDESHPLLEAIKDDIFLLNANPADENIEKMFEHLKTLERLQIRIGKQNVPESSPNYTDFNDLKEEVSELQTWIQVNRPRATAELRKIKEEQDKVEDFVATFLQPYLQGKINPATEGDRKPLEMQLQEALGVGEKPLNKGQFDAAVDTFIREGMKALNQSIMAGISGKITPNYNITLYPEMIEVFLGRLEISLPKEFPSLNLSGEQIRERFTKILATFK